MLKKFNIIISNTRRSKKYIDILFLNKIYPQEIFYLDNKKDQKIKSALKQKILMYKKNYKIKFFSTESTNDLNFLKYVLKSKEKNIIFSGYPGDIIKNSKLLKKKNILHSHPGYLPKFKGSTTIYYSLLKINKIYCTTFIMNKKIDAGKILLRKEYEKPKNIKLIEDSYDDEIRAKNLLTTLKKFNSLKNKKIKNNYLPYYIIHPVLRQITFEKS